jgi:hypothetical protein
MKRAKLRYHKDRPRRGWGRISAINRLLDRMRSMRERMPCDDEYDRIARKWPELRRRSEP